MFPEACSNETVEWLRSSAPSRNHLVQLLLSDGYSGRNGGRNPPGTKPQLVDLFLALREKERDRRRTGSLPVHTTSQARKVADDMLTSKACGPSTSSPGATSAMDIVATSPADNIAGARLAQPQSGSVSGSKPGPMLQHVGRSPAHTHAANSADVGHYTPDPASIPGVGGGGGGGGGGGSTGVHPGRDNRVEALRWARSIMSEKEWLNPPNHCLMVFHMHVGHCSKRSSAT